MADGKDPVGGELQSRLRHALVMGLARQPVAVPPQLNQFLGPADRDPALALLALSGQRARFARPSSAVIAQTSEVARAMHDDPRPMMPERARLALRRLQKSVGKTLIDDVMATAVHRVCGQGFRLHPFDFPALAKHLKADGFTPGKAESAYLSLIAKDEREMTVSTFDLPTLAVSDVATIASNWTTWGKAARRAIFTNVRREDAEASRVLLAEVFKTEPADVRAKLVEALAYNLSDADTEFLEGLAGDRAESVRAAAEKIQQRMPGGDREGSRLKEAAGYFETKKTASKLLGAIGVGTSGTLIFKPPVKETNWTKIKADRDRVFGGLPIDKLADHLGVQAEDILDALPADENIVVTHFIDTATTNGDDASVERIIARRLVSGQMLSPHLLGELARRMERPMAAASAKAVLNSTGWQNTIGQYKDATTNAGMNDDGRIVFTATLMPPELHSVFLESVEPLMPATTRGARDFIDLSAALHQPA